jgi:CheY-like chemotaxis protein
MTFLRILVVEDYVPFRRLVCSTLLQKPEFQVIGEASDGLEAVQKAGELQPDLVLLDIGLPKLNGFQAAQQISTAAPCARLLFVSQESSSDILQEAFRLGADGYVHKQRAQNDLFHAIDAVLAGKTFVSEGLEFSGSAPGAATPSHEILFCGNDDTLLNSVTTFFIDALSARDPVIGVFTQSRWNGLRWRLHARGVDIDAVIQRGTFISLDADQTLTRSDLFEAIKHACEAAVTAGKSHPRVAICGERAGRLWAEGKTDEAIRIEQFCRKITTFNNVSILCVYPWADRQSDDHALKTICEEHTAVYSR